jgi:hypothetical protein
MQTAKPHRRPAGRKHWRVSVIIATTPGDDLVRRVEERGGEIRLCRSTIQYRPPSVLTTMEAKWIRDHCETLHRRGEVAE